jgi:peptidyl-prolyl cis-trans isomerase C
MIDPDHPRYGIYGSGGCSDVGAVFSRKGSHPMNFGSRFIVVLLPLIILFSACKGAATREQGASAVLATVNGVAITGDDVVLRLGGHERLLNTPMKDRVLEDIITDELLYQEGVKLGLDRDAKYRGMIRMMELKITEFKRAEIARRVMESQVAAKVNVTEREVKDYFDKNVREIGTDLHLGLLHFDTAAEANDALTKIRAGKTSFEKVAAEKFSHIPKGSKQTWDMGYMHWNQISPDLRELVYRLKKDEISDVQDRSPNGCFFIKVIDRKQNAGASFASINTAVENRLHMNKTREAYDQYIQKLKGGALIKKNGEGTLLSIK